MSGFVVIVLALAVLAGVVWVQRRWPLLQYLYFCRFQILVATVLIGFPFAATRTGAAGLLENLFWLDARGIFIVSWMALLAAWVVMVAVEVVFQNAHLRFRVDPVSLPPSLRRLKPWLFSLLAVPFIAAAVVQSTEPPWTEGWAVVRGVVTAAACLVAAALLHTRLLPLGTPGEDLLVPGIARLFMKLPGARRRLAVPPSLRPENLGAATVARNAEGPRRLPLEGYVEEGTGFIRPGHLVALALLLVTLGVYVYYGRRGPLPAAQPALGYLLLVLILAGWVLPSLSFLLDRYRVPLVLLLVAASFVWSDVSDTGHYYRIARDRSRLTTISAPGTVPAQVFRKAEETDVDRDRRPIVVVAASGGGITASLWTAVVLTSLQRTAGPELTRSIRLISAVSGGSVGTMYFLDRFGEAGHPPESELDRIVYAAGRPSLDSAAWGLAYPDLWRASFGFLLRDPTRDRGWAMEQAWRKEMAHGDATLGSWRRKLDEAKLPAVVFNATEVETGRQFLFTPLSGGWRSRFFSQVYRGFDVPVATAARLSATFPWVSPITRACVGRCGEEAIEDVHIADGGYFDNYGVVTVINWIRSLTPDQRTELERHKVLLVLIRAFPATRPGPPDTSLSEEQQGWLYGTLGPILTMYNVRNAAQDDRNVTELSLLKQLLRSEVEDRLEVVEFELKTKSPLSWKLTKEEDEAIRQGMVKDPANLRSLRRVEEIFRRPPTPPSPP